MYSKNGGTSTKCRDTECLQMDIKYREYTQNIFHKLKTPRRSLKQRRSLKGLQFRKGSENPPEGF